MLPGRGRGGELGWGWATCCQVSSLFLGPLGRDYAEESKMQKWPGLVLPMGLLGSEHSSSCLLLTPWEAGCLLGVVHRRTALEFPQRPRLGGEQ